MRISPALPTNRRSHGYTLIELLITIAMVAAIAWMATGIWTKTRLSFEKGACVKKVHAIGVALHAAMLAEADGYPSPPEEIEDADMDSERPGDEKLDEWWYNMLSKYGLEKAEDWVCPSQASYFEQLRREHNIEYFSSYLIVPNSGKEQPMKYQTPWVVDKNAHDGESNVYMPDGTVKGLRLD
jgi:prepilin-type N-terminal cleavage/methylation domain-containing protein